MKVFINEDRAVIIRRQFGIEDGAQITDEVMDAYFDYVGQMEHLIACAFRDTVAKYEDTATKLEKARKIVTGRV